MRSAIKYYRLVIPTQPYHQWYLNLFSAIGYLYPTTKEAFTNKMIVLMTKINLDISTQERDEEG